MRIESEILLNGNQITLLATHGWHRSTPQHSHCYTTSANDIFTLRWTSLTHSVRLGTLPWLWEVNWRLQRHGCFLLSLPLLLHSLPSAPSSLPCSSFLRYFSPPLTFVICTWEYWNLNNQEKWQEIIIKSALYLFRFVSHQ